MGENKTNEQHVKKKHTWNGNHLRCMETVGKMHPKREKRDRPTGEVENHVALWSIEENSSPSGSEMRAPGVSPFEFCSKIYFRSRSSRSRSGELTSKSELSQTLLRKPASSLVRIFLKTSHKG